MFASKQTVLLMVSKTLIDKKGETNVVSNSIQYLVSLISNVVSSIDTTNVVSSITNNVSNVIFTPS